MIVTSQSLIKMCLNKEITVDIIMRINCHNSGLRHHTCYDVQHYDIIICGYGAIMHVCDITMCGCDVKVRWKFRTMTSQWNKDELYNEVIIHDCDVTESNCYMHKQWSHSGQYNAHNYVITVSAIIWILNNKPKV